MSLIVSTLSLQDIWGTEIQQSGEQISRSHSILSPLKSSRLSMHKTYKICPAL